MISSLQSIWREFLAHLPNYVAGLILLLATALAAILAKRLLQRLLRSVHMRESLKHLLERLAVLVVWFLGLMVVAMIVFPSLSPADALTALGVGSIAVGLAFKDIFENLFAGILILWRFPFENEDLIRCQEVEGRVLDVTIRNTLVKTVSGELIVVPNAMLYKHPVPY